MTATTPPPAQGFEPAAPATFAHRLQYGATRLVVALLRVPGWRVASAVGALLGRLVYTPIGIRRDVVERHLTAAFPEMSAPERTRTARAAYESLGRTSIETAVLPGTPRDQLLAMVAETEGWELLDAALAQGKGVILATGHLGNWELGGAYIAARGVPVSAITRRMANPLFDRYLRGTRAAMDVEVIHDAVAVRRVPRALGEGRLIAFLCDQDGIGLASTFVPFFGRPARTPRGPGVFALRLGTPVLFAACLRRPDGRYRIVFDTVPVHDTGDRERDVDAIVAAFTQRLETEVRRTPGQYFWHHRRWKRQPPDTPQPLREP
jgi:Kdo2-lipid IVA lauroyltransferase/acyltransferase